MAVLGLDISTTCTGFTILDDNKEIVKVGYWELTKLEFEDTPDNEDDLLYAKADYLIKQIDELCLDYGIYNIVIEKQLVMVGGKDINSAFKLNSMNSIISHHLFSQKKKIIKVYSQTARKNFLGNDYAYFTKLPKTDDAKKEFLSNRAKEQLSKFIEFEARPKRTDKYKSYIYDVVDSYIVALAGK